MLAEFIDGVIKVWSGYGSSFIDGAINTLIVSFIGTVAGCIIGFGVGVVQTSPIEKKDPLLKKIIVKIVNLILKGYVELFRGTPMIVQSVFIYYGTIMIFDYKMDPYFAALVIVSINTGAYMAETVRGGILSIDPGQTEGAKAIGMNHIQTMMNVIIPQAFRNIIPQIGNNFIINIKDTSVLSVISFADLFFQHKSATGALYRFFESASIVMVIYLIMTVTASFLLRLLEKKLDGDDNYDLATTDTLAHTSGMYTYHPKEKTLEDFK
ncbi:MAG: amino acid ABC transporter permease [Oscillospiraceae bacterium]|nr:amino acid ABC transporter permease [Oscillospiraceae bacterium]